MKKIYSILDIKADELGPLMTFKHEAAAIRAFSDLAKTEGTTVQRHPEDYALLCLGAINEHDNPTLGTLAHTILALNGNITIMTGEQFLAANSNLTTEDKNNAS